ncbi:YhcH/YjgK/YiaL family protein [Leptotrichia wadei]|uniref:YhcH/YjgK/YiaL family protein n=1 Tax=Leptotrichia wadei (strain F0279) TaxID=888055 RepID=U2R6B1_LEPWF|nr:YhcH/YjgK/YiaL family protein [Leptotrichia wadei]ERK49173.1 YhcH/YjgK/YiaL family protein [Leptotrichia wadei F0279]
MIFTNVNDELQNSSLTKDIQFCIDYATKNKDEILSLKNGSYDIDYNGIKMNVGKYFTKKEEDKFWESHKKYLDVQIMIDGSERVAINDIRNMREKSFDSERDLVILEGNKLFDIVIGNGDVLVFFPNDVHKPELDIFNSENEEKCEDNKKIVTKVVFKIEIGK